MYDKLACLLSGVAELAFRRRAEVVERSFALVPDRGGIRGTRLRGHANVDKRDLLHVAGYKLGLIMRLLTGHDAPQEVATTLHAAVGITFLTDDPLIAVVGSPRLRDRQRRALPNPPPRRRPSPRSRDAI